MKREVKLVLGRDEKVVVTMAQNNTDVRVSFFRPNRWRESEQEVTTCYLTKGKVCDTNFIRALERDFGHPKTVILSIEAAAAELLREAVMEAILE